MRLQISLTCARVPDRGGAGTPGVVLMVADCPCAWAMEIPAARGGGVAFP